MLIAKIVSVCALILGAAVLVRAIVFRRNVTVYKSGPFMGRPGNVRLSVLGTAILGLGALGIGVVTAAAAAFGQPLDRGAWPYLLLGSGVVTFSALAFRERRSNRWRPTPGIEGYRQRR